MIKTTPNKRLGKKGYRKYVRSASDGGCGCGKKANRVQKASANKDKDKEIKFI